MFLFFVLYVLISTLLVKESTAQNSTLEESGFGGFGAKDRVFQQPPYDDYSDLQHFDYIVVGAGPSGCVLARRLTEDNATVLLLEAGGRETWGMGIPYFNGQTPDTDYNYVMEPQPFGGCPTGPEARCAYPRGRGTGGGTLTNLMIWTRGAIQDYEHWKELGNTKWGFDDVLPYFRKVEDVQIEELQDSEYRGTGGPVAVTYPFLTPLANLTLGAAAALGIPEVDYNGASSAGVARVQSSTLNGARVSAWKAYLLGLRRSNLKLRTQAKVTKVIIEDNVAVGVEYVKDGVNLTAYACKEVILSAGAVNTPQILMLSGIGPQADLEDLGIPVVQNLSVGNGLTDHAAFVGQVFTTNTSLFPTRAETLTNVSTVAEYFASQTGTLSSLRTTSMLVYQTIGEDASNKSWPNAETYLFAQTGLVDRGAYGFSEDFYNSYSKPLSKFYSFQPFTFNLRPKSTGTVKLQSTNPFDSPLIDPKFFSESEDVEILLEALNGVTKLFTAGPFADFDTALYSVPLPACANETVGTDDYWRCAIHNATWNIFHPCCTARMGPDGDEGAVVDNNLLVRGVDGLRVADTSVMPTIVGAHLQFVAYMIGEVAADLIKSAHEGESSCCA